MPATLPLRDWYRSKPGVTKQASTAHADAP